MEDVLESERRIEDSGSAPTLELYREWRAPRFGRSNPERMNNFVWEWLVRTRINAYSAAEYFHEPSALRAGPGWCFDRSGQSTTSLPDGRTVLISGEHEDYYDPDFQIYNDVVVRHPGGGIDIYGYPREIFPPTDFHSATLVGNQIVIIGCLGYKEDQDTGDTPVYVLDLSNFAISRATTMGASPGRLHEHHATLSEDGTAILIRGGMIDRVRKGGSVVENIDDWRLQLDSWQWTNLTDRHWPRWRAVRVDRKPNQLWDVDQMLWYKGAGWQKEFDETIGLLREAYGSEPALDLARNLYCPPLIHETVQKCEGEYDTFRIRVDGVIVRYAQKTHEVQMTIEGDLPSAAQHVLTSDLVKKLSALENAPYELNRL